MLDALQQAWISGLGSVQGRIGSARDHAAETWDGLEALFQTRVQKALQQIGVPTREEVRLLTQRVTELNESVRSLATRRAAGAKSRRRARARRRGKVAR